MNSQQMLQQSASSVARALVAANPGIGSAPLPMRIDALQQALAPLAYGVSPQQQMAVVQMVAKAMPAMARQAVQGYGSQVSIPFADAAPADPAAYKAQALAAVAQIGADDPGALIRLAQASIPQRAQMLSNAGLSPPDALSPQQAASAFNAVIAAVPGMAKAAVVQAQQDVQAHAAGLAQANPHLQQLPPDQATAAIVGGLQQAGVLPDHLSPEQIGQAVGAVTGCPAAQQVASQVLDPQAPSGPPGAIPPPQLVRSPPITAGSPDWGQPSSQDPWAAPGAGPAGMQNVNSAVTVQGTVPPPNTALPYQDPNTFVPSPAPGLYTPFPQQADDAPQDFPDSESDETDENTGGTVDPDVWEAAVDDGGVMDDTGLGWLKRQHARRNGQ